MDESTQIHRNRLLQLLSPADLDRLRPHLEPVKFENRQPLYDADEDIQFVYFPVEGVASFVATMKNGAAAEVGTIGNEGMVGLPIILGDSRAPTTTCVFVQVPGSGLRLRAEVLREEMEFSSSVRTVMLHYAHAFFNQVTQSAACSCIHPIEKRCCRWLLMTHDRVQSDTFLLTHKFLGMMLGVRRSGVSVAANKLKQLKLIEYVRGQVTILNRPGLEKRACECYFASRNEFNRLLGNPFERRSAATQGTLP